MVDEPFDLNVFNGILDEAEEEAKPNLTRMATEKEIKELCTFIGGFEKWTLLNDDCRREVIRLLDYRTRIKISFCSRKDYEIANKLPVYIHSIKIEEDSFDWHHFTYKRFNNIAIRVHFDERYDDYIEQLYSQSGEDTRIHWLKFRPEGPGKVGPDHKSVLVKSSKFHEVAIKFVEKMMKKSKYEIKILHLHLYNISYPIESSEIQALPNCKTVYINVNNLNTLRWWIQKLPEKLDRIELGSRNNTIVYSSDFLFCPQIMNTPILHLWPRVLFTDEQFLKLKVTSMYISCMSITEDGINQFLKNWVSGNGVKGLKNVVILCPNESRDEMRIIRDIDVREWDDAFRTERGTFCLQFEEYCDYGHMYQIKSRIDPFESVTLCMNNQRVSIYFTGKRVDEGEDITYTHYQIPY
ncbi:unnamed protein product [Caenorhabditis brenneri]